MAIVTIAELKSYFETGDKPTEQQFVNLIDTLAAGGVATPDLQQVTNAGATTSVGITVDNGTESINIKQDQIIINNSLGNATITSPTLTSATEFQIPNKATSPQTFAMLTDIGNLVPYTGATADVDLDTNGLDAKFVKIKGTGGDGHLNLKHQSSASTAGGSESVIYADASGNPKWKNDGNAVEDVLTNSNTVIVTNKRITSRSGTVASSATPTINTDNVDYYSITALAAAITSFTTNLSGTPTIGQTLWISITDNGTARAITWGASFESSTITLPTTTVISTRLDVAFIWNEATSKWRCVGVA